MRRLVTGRRIAGAAVLSALIVVVCGIVIQQQRRIRHRPVSWWQGAKLAVELPQPDGPAGILSDRYVIVRERGLTSTEMSLRSLRPRPGGAADASPANDLKLDFAIEQDELTTTVYTIPPESNPLRYSDGHKHRLGVHTARLNETVELKELARIWEITLQRAAPVRQPDRLASDKARYRRTWMRSGLAKIAPAASALGKDLGPCCEVSGHSGARQQGGLRNGWLRRSPSITAIRARTAMRHLASRCGGWRVYTQSQRRDQRKVWSMSRVL